MGGRDTAFLLICIEIKQLAVIDFGKKPPRKIEKSFIYQCVSFFFCFMAILTN